MLDADPLYAIANTTKVSGVVARGRNIGPDERLEIIADVERVAATTPAGLVVAGGCPCHTPRRAVAA